MKFILDILNIRKNEFANVLIFFIYSFLLVTILIFSKTVRDTLFLTEFQITFLPLMYLLSSLAIWLVTNFIWIRRKSYNFIENNYKLFSIFFIITILFGFYKNIKLIPVFYVWTEILTLFMGIVFWDYASLAFDNLQAKRIFPVISAGGALSGIFAGGALPYIIAQLNLYNSMIFISFLIILIIICLKISTSFVKLKYKPEKSIKEFINKNKSPDEFIKSIILFTIVSSLIYTLVDYQFKSSVSFNFSNRDEMILFFGKFYMYTSMLSLFVQLFLSNKIISQIGVAAGILILPIAFLLSPFSILFFSNLGFFATVKGLEQVFKPTILSSAMEIVWFPVNTIKKNFFKPLINGPIKLISQSIVGLALFLISFYQFKLDFLIVCTITIMSTVWILISLKIKKLYLKQILKVIQTRQLDLDSVNIDLRNNEITEIFKKYLFKDQDTQFYILNILKDLDIAPLKKQLHKVYISGSERIQKTILFNFGTYPDIVTDEFLKENLKNKINIAISLKLLKNRNFDKNSILPYIKNNDIDVKISALAALKRYDIIDECFKKFEVTENTFSLIPDNYNPSCNFLSFCLKHKKIKVRESAIKFISLRNNYSFIKELFENIDNRYFSKLIVKFLDEHPNEKIVKFIKSCKDPYHAIFYLNFSNNKQIKKYLELFLDTNSKVTLSKCLEALVRNNANNQFSRLEKIQIFIDDITSEFKNNQLLQLLADRSKNEIFNLILIEKNKINAINLSHLIQLKINRLPYGYVDLINKESSKVTYLTEALENYLDKSEAKDILPVINYKNNKLDYTNNEIKILSPEIDLLTRSYNQWEKIHLFLLLKDNNLQIDYLSKDIKVNKYNNLISTVGEDSMYSRIEKILILKSLSIFDNISTEQLNIIAAISKEIYIEKNIKIFSKSELGDYMMIIIDGSVRVHDSLRDIAVLNSGSFFGELSILDNEQRSADITSLTDCVLLKIEREDFLSVLDRNKEISKSIIKVLSKRLRETNKKLY
ncbi:MAG: hypothetical protein CBD58_02205 [bacterium TMED198]|nr:MAG: hypothetical protein CBD58_02205 [bacterium TMED198]